MSPAIIALGLLALVLLLPLLVAAARHREVPRLAARNLGRRRAEATLVVAGALLGTAIVTSSFVVGDIVDGSISDVARTQLGPVDITLTPADGDLAAVRAAVDAADIAGVDGLLEVSRTTVALERAADGDRTAAALPRTALVALDLASARAFGDDGAATGLDLVAGDLAGNEVVINERTADRLDANPGDRVALHAYGTTAELRVSQVVPEVGLAGYGGAVVAPEVLSRMAGAVRDAAPPQHQLLISLDGGVFDTDEAAPDAVAVLRNATADLEAVEIEPVKAALLEEARSQGSSLAELFTTIGAFSVLAGILLLVNLFVMLAEERKTELGMLRAVGFTRRRLASAFAFEGALYAMTAAALGTALGVGLGWLVARVAGSIFGLTDDGLVFRLVVEPGSLAAGGLIGLSISLVTIWATSSRIARLNVIRAIRDLPEPPRVGLSLRRAVAACSGVLLGAAGSIFGVIEKEPMLLLAGVPVAAFAAGPLLRRVLPDRAARLISAGTALAWGVAAFPLFGDIMGAAELPIFIVQGVVLTSAAVSLVSSLDTVWAALLGRLAPRGGGLAVRLGMAYPLARRVRTSLLLGMFSLVIFTMTIIASLTAAVEGQRTDITNATRGGFDVLVDANHANPVTTTELTANDEVVAAAGLRHATAEFAAGDDRPRPWALTGFDVDLVAFGAPGLAARADGYASDAEVWAAVATDPSLAIIPESFLGDGGPQAAVVGVGEQFEVVDPFGGPSRTLTAVAHVSYDMVWNGALVSADLTAELFGAQDVVSRHYLAVADGVSADTLAAQLEAQWLARGVEAQSFTGLVDEVMRQDNAFMTLLQGFLGLGLLVGIAGLGVVMIRAVRERRAQIGMLRAMGFSTGLVRRAFLTEAGLIAAQGAAIGMALGLVTIRQVLTSSEAFGSGTMAFTVPWTGLLVVGLLPLVAALMATAWPAIRAARIAPAVALRVSD